MYRGTLFVFLVLTGWLPVKISADMITLNTGSRILGIILSENSEEVVMACQMLDPTVPARKVSILKKFIFRICRQENNDGLLLPLKTIRLPEVKK